VATERSVLRRALVSCVLVGVLLTAVNHGPELARGEIDPLLVVQVALTLLIPLVVSIVSSVAAIRALTLAGMPAPPPTTASAGKLGLLRELDLFDGLSDADVDAIGDATTIGRGGGP